MSTLLRFPLGDFDYDGQLFQTRPALAPWFFVGFLAMIYLVSMNIAIAIITEYFDQVHEATKVSAVAGRVRAAHHTGRGKAG